MSMQSLYEKTTTVNSPRCLMCGYVYQGWGGDVGVGGGGGLDNLYMFIRGGEGMWGGG